METKERSKLGKKSRAQGVAFEKRVFEDLKSKGWIISRWPNKVELIRVIDKAEIREISIMSNGMIDPAYNVKDSHVEGKLVQAKAKWINGRIIGMNSGFPDFIAFRKVTSFDYQVIGVESKITGELDKAEKEQINWYLDNKIFSKILIAYKTKVKNRVIVNYREFQ